MSKFYFQRFWKALIYFSVHQEHYSFSISSFSGASSVSAFPLHPPIGSEQSLMLPIFKIKQRKYSDLSLQTSPTLFLFPETIVYNMFCLHFLLPTLLPLLCICPRPTETALIRIIKAFLFPNPNPSFFFFFNRAMNSIPHHESSPASLNILSISL